MRTVTLIFFKPSGKYYTEEKNEYPEEWEVWEISDHIKENERRYRGMHIVLQFDPNDNKGFPVLILAENRHHYYE